MTPSLLPTRYRRARRPSFNPSWPVQPRRFIVWSGSNAPHRHQQLGTSFFLPHFFLSVLAFPLFHLLLSGCNFSFFFSFSVATFRCLDVPRTASTPSHQTHTLPSFVNAVLSSLPHSLPILARPRPFVDDQLASGTTRKHDPLIGNMNDCDNQYSVHPVNVEQSLFLATVGRMNRSLGKSFRLRYPKERSLRVLWEVFVQ